jgi:hypothetical protein
VRYILTAHAVERFIERVRSGLSWSGAEMELERVLEHGQLTEQPPVWLAERSRPDASMYVSLGDVVLPLAPSRERVGQWIALTCLTSGTLAPAVRARRKAAHEMRRRSRRGDASGSFTASRARRRARLSSVEDEFVAHTYNETQMEA